MSPDLERLIRLQQIETALAEAKGRIATHPQRLGAADATLNDAKAALDAAKERLKVSQDTRRALEKDAAVFQGRLSKYKDQLAAIKTNREYQAMQHEIATAQTDLGAIEEKVLERMMEADTVAAEVKAADGALATRQKDVDAEKRALAEELAQLEQQIKKQTAARASIAAELEPRLVTLFEQVARMRKGTGVCAAQNGLCSLCHVRLRPHVFQQVRANDSIIQCDSCQRILFFVPPPAPVEPPATHAS